MKVFITGGTGNIGQYVTLLAAEHGHGVTALTRRPEDYPYLAEKARLVKGDISEYGKIREYVTGCDAVIHIALGWGKEPAAMLKNDTEVTVNLLEIAERAGVSSFIYTSSTAAMGHMRNGMDESYANLPLDLYGATKSASEAYVLGFTKYYGGGAVTMRRNIIRPGYTYSNPPYAGERSQSDSRFRDIADAVIKNAPVKLTEGDGTQFLSAQEIARLYIKLLESDKNEEVYLALGKDYTTWQEIAETAIKETDSGSTIEYIGKNRSPVPFLYNADKINRDFGLSFGSKDDLSEHIKWNLEEARKRAGN